MSNTDTDTHTNTDTHTDPATGTSDPRVLLARAIDTAAAVVAGIRPEHHRVTTPCADFDVEQLVGHLLFALDRVATVGRGDELGLEDAVFTSTDWSADVHAAADAITAAWADDSRLGDTIELPWAVMTGAEAVAIYTNEVTTHTWDLAVATGQSVDWDDEVVTTSLAAIRSQLPVADRDAMWQGFLDQAPAEVAAGFAPPFANAESVGDDAPMIDRLVAWNGRRP